MHLCKPGLGSGCLVKWWMAGIRQGESSLTTWANLALFQPKLTGSFFVSMTKTRMCLQISPSNKCLQGNFKYHQVCRSRHSFRDPFSLYEEPVKNRFHRLSDVWWHQAQISILHIISFLELMKSKRKKTVRENILIARFRTQFPK